MDKEQQALHRARANGIRIGKSKRSGNYYATSATSPGKYYLVGDGGCQCKGFIRWGLCQHAAAYREARRKEGV